jgi:hypothetical protein
VQIEQLGGDDMRIETPLAHVPGRTLGYEVLGRYRVSNAVASTFRDAFGRRDSYACAPGASRASFATPDAVPIGVHFGEGAQAVTVVLHLPEGVAEIQVEGLPRVSAPLSRAGQLRWELAITMLTRASHTTPEELYRQMTPPGRVPAAPAPPADSSPPRDAPRAPR